MQRLVVFVVFAIAGGTTGGIAWGAPAPAPAPAPPASGPPVPVPRVPAPPVPAPAPLASARGDLDGDGRDDDLTIGADGVLTASLPGGRATVVVTSAEAGASASASAGDARRATLAIDRSTRPASVVATVDRADGSRLAAIAAWDGHARALALRWSGPIGPVGRDAEYDVRVEVTAAGIVRSQHRAGVERCDGEPARLFAEAWDGRGFRRASTAVTIADGAIELAAAAAGAPDRSFVFRATAASAQAGASDAGELASPRAIDDGDPATAWRADGDGVGEFVTFRARLAGARAAGLRIVPGDATSAAARDAHNRIARLAVVGGGKAYWIRVGDQRADEKTPLWVKFPEPISSPCVTVVIAGVHRGKSGAAATAIAELSVLSEAELVPGGLDKTLAGEVAAGGTDGVSAARVLAGRGAAGAQALIDELGARGGASDVAVRRRLVAALIASGDPLAARPIAAALAQGDITGGDVEVAMTRLAAMGGPGSAALIALVADGKTPVETRAGAVRGLGGAGGGAAAIDAIVGLAGDRSPALRRAVIDALARQPAAELIARARALTGAAAADVWRAAAIAGRGDATVRAALRGVLTAGASYDERYRAIEALAEGDAGDVGAVVSALPTLGDSAQASALKQVAATGFGRNHTAEAGRALVALAGDGDVGVRLAAIGALAQREPGGAGGTAAGTASTSGPGPGPDATLVAERDAIDRVIGNALAGDHWPELRRAAAAALSARCARPGPAAALGGALDGDPDDAVRGDAIAALVACHAPGVAARLWKVADDGHATAALRVRAVDLIVVLGDASLARGLEDRFATWRGQAFSDDAALALAVHAAVALGRTGDRGALPGLVDAAGDGAFPELQAAAATALGELPPCPPAVRQTLDALTTSEQRNVALAARRARTKCTK